MKLREIISFVALVVMPLGICEPVSAQGDTEPVKAILNDLVITGKSNLNKFNLFLGQESQAGAHELITGLFGLRSISFEIPLDRLSCKNKMILHDFYSLVNASEFPEVTIKMDADDFDRFVAETESHTTQASFYVTIAGITQKVRTHTLLSEDLAGNKTLRGNLTLSMNDFYLKPPKKMIGLVKLNDEVNINFIISISDNINSRHSETEFKNKVRDPDHG